jgi:hypothetical protein
MEVLVASDFTPIRNLREPAATAEAGQLGDEHRLDTSGVTQVLA